MRTSEEYKQDLYKMRPNVYIRGKRVRRDDPELSGGIYVISKTFDLAEHPDFKDLVVTKSHITGERINRFTHVCQTMEDLLT